MNHIPTQSTYARDRGNAVRWVGGEPEPQSEGQCEHKIYGTSNFDQPERCPEPALPGTNVCEQHDR